MRVQRLLSKMLVARDLANMEERALLTNGTKVHRPYYSEVRVNNYTKGTAVTPQDVTASDEYLTIDQTKEATVYVDEIDVIQNKYDTANILTERIAYQLKRDIDGKFLDEVVNAGLSMTDVDMGGTAAYITVNTSNLIKLFATAEAKMNSNNVEDTKPWFAVITPAMKALIQQSMIYNGFQKADAGLDGAMLGNGFVGRFMNFNVYSSNNVYHTQTLTNDTTNNTAGGTFTVAGVTFTLTAAASAAVAGDVAVGGSATACMTNIFNAINCTGAGSAATFIPVSEANQTILRNARVVATNPSATTVVITSSGPVTVTEALDHSAWGVQVANCFFGQQGCTDMVIQKDVTVQQNKVPDKTGYNYLCYDLYGVKTFTEGANRSMKVAILA
jgi:hypothetical protein